MIFLLLNWFIDRAHEFIEEALMIQMQSTYSKLLKIVKDLEKCLQLTICSAELSSRGLKTFK